MSQDKISLITVIDHENNTFNIVVADKNKVSKVKIRLYKINMPNKIHFHNKTSDIIYVDLLQSTFDISKMETKVSKLEGSLNRKKKIIRHGRLK